MPSTPRAARSRWIPGTFARITFWGPYWPGACARGRWRRRLKPRAICASALRTFRDIARIYLAEGDPLGAAEELRLYLKTGNAGDRATVERWLAALKL